MIRVFLFFIIAAVLAAGAAMLADNPGALVINWLGWEVRTSFGVAFLLLLFAAVLLIVLYRFYLNIRRAPILIGDTFAARRRRRGLQALTQGLVAVAAGDVESSRKFAKRAEHLLEAQPLLQLLGAQAAQMEGDDAAVSAHYQAMLEAPETEILGLRGLLTQALRDDDKEAALGYAARAFALKPQSLWAYQSLLDLQCAKGDWEAALVTLKKAKKKKTTDSDVLMRQHVVLLCAKAAHALETDDTASAETCALKAHKMMADFTPAALLASSILQSRKQDWKAAGLLEESWRAAPHPALVEAYIALKPDETAHDRATRLSGLVEMRPNHMEGRLLQARQAINTRRWDDARIALEPLVEATPTARVCALMAEIEQGELDNVGGAREWLARAVTAPPEPEWVRAKLEFDTADWAALVRLFADVDAAWPPEPDPTQFTDVPNVVSPFNKAFQPFAQTAHNDAEPVTDAPVVIVEEPVATDYVVDDEQATERSVPLVTEEEVKPTRVSAPAADTGLKSVRGNDDAVLRSKDAAKRRPKKRIPLFGARSPARLSESLVSSSTLARQPDDPGPDLEDDY